MKTLTIMGCNECPHLNLGTYCGHKDRQRFITYFPSFPDWCPIPDSVVRDSRNAESEYLIKTIEMIGKVHEAMEGRYNLDGEDLLTIQYLLCQNEILKEQAFKAGREYHLHNSYKYETFEDYKKEQNE